MLAFLRNQGGTRSAVFEPDGSWSSALDGAPFHLSYASVHHGAQHHVGEFFLSSRSNSEFRVDPETVCFSSFGEGGRCQSTCSQPHYLTIAYLYFSPLHNPNALVTEGLLQPWDGWQAYAFPPCALIPAVL